MNQKQDGDHINSRSIPKNPKTLGDHVRIWGHFLTKFEVKRAKIKKRYGRGKEGHGKRPKF